MRSLSIEEAKIPPTLQDALESTFKLGNPWSGGIRDRIAWTEDVEVEDYEDQDILWWVCCTAAYDERVQKTARAIVRLLDSVDASFGTLWHG